MNLEDVIDPEYGLQQDDWSLSKPRFGDEGQLEVVGWSGRKSTHKTYVLKCNKCSTDCEMFGDGYFKTVKSILISGSVPCGCTLSPRWSKEQYEVLCSRKAKDLGYTFLGFNGKWAGHKTKIKMLCDEHGRWDSGCITNLLAGRGCPDCNAGGNFKSDSEMIASFFASGAFHPDTKFWRSDSETGRGFKYWYTSCPDCMQIGEALPCSLRKGSRPCACSMHRAQEAYINLIMDGNNSIAIKFGIARDSSIRVQQQDSSSIYTLKQHSIHAFPDVKSCKAAERECKQTLECGVVLKRDMPDGYTETTWLYNLEKVKALYEKHGGIVVS